MWCVIQGQGFFYDVKGIILYSLLAIWSSERHLPTIALRPLFSARTCVCVWNYFHSLAGCRPTSIATAPATVAAFRSISMKRFLSFILCIALRLAAFVFSAHARASEAAAVVLLTYYTILVKWKRERKERTYTYHGRIYYKTDSY